MVKGITTKQAADFFRAQLKRGEDAETIRECQQCRYTFTALKTAMPLPKDLPCPRCLGLLEVVEGDTTFINRW